MKNERTSAWYRHRSAWLVNQVTTDDIIKVRSLRHPARFVKKTRLKSHNQIWASTTFKPTSCWQHWETPWNYTHITYRLLTGRSSSTRSRKQATIQWFCKPTIKTINRLKLKTCWCRARRRMVSLCLCNRNWGREPSRGRTLLTLRSARKKSRWWAWNNLWTKRSTSNNLRDALEQTLRLRENYIRQQRKLALQLSLEIFLAWSNTCRKMI